MRYLVMETHPAYAVVLDVSGSVLKCANFGYSVGQSVDDIEPMKPAPRRAAPLRRLSVFAAAAACLCLLYFGAYRPNFVPYGSVRMTINPDVVMTVSRSGRVISIDGLNSDGQTLINGYSGFLSKEADAAAELMGMASRQGFLKDGGSVKLNISSGDTDWARDIGSDLSDAMDDGVDGKSVVIFISFSGSGKPDLVITASDGSHKNYTYDQWQALQPARSGGASPSQDIEDWGEQQGDSWEQWGEQQGSGWEDFGEQVGGIFSDGFDGQSDVSGLFGKLNDMLG
jgi:hypothetical protein